MDGQEDENMVKEPIINGDNRVERDEKGHFLPGNIANPEGRPKGSISLVSLLKEKLKEIPPGEKMSYAEALIIRVVKDALEKGDVGLIKDIFNRVDGMPKQIFGIDADDILTKLEIEIVKPKKDGGEDNRDNSI